MRVKLFLMAVLMMGMFQVNLFPWISSRIQGEVVDEAGNPVNGVNVLLFDCGDKSYGHPFLTIITGTNGKFKYDDLKASNYSIFVFKKQPQERAHAHTPS